MKRFLRTAAVLTGLTVLAGIPAVRAQDTYPNRPVRIIVGFPTGGPTDILVRIFAEKLGQKFSHRFYIENMPGGASNTASAAAARAEPDGYTLFVATSANSSNVSLYKNLRYKFPDDFMPISMVASTPLVLGVSAALQVNSVQELIAAAKARPGEITYAHAGIGTGGHMAAELMNMMASIKLRPVPYQATSQAVTDLLTGRVSVVFTSFPVLSGFANDPRLKLLAVTSERRIQAAPQLPTAAESGLPGFEIAPWFGLVAPKGTSQAILKTVADAIEEVARLDDVKRQLAAANADRNPLSLDAFGAFMARDVPRWAKVIEFAGIKIE